MENPEEVLQSLDEFAKLKPKDIPRELEEYLLYVAKTGDPVYQWSLVKCLFREKMLNVITDFYESSPTMELPPCPNVDPFNYETMKADLLERLDSFLDAPFTVQRLCELLTTPRKEYTRVDKFMRAIEKNILVVSTKEPGSSRRTESQQPDFLMNGVMDGRGLDISEAIETVSSDGVNLMHEAGEGEVTMAENIRVECAGQEDMDMEVTATAPWAKESTESALKAEAMESGKDEEVGVATQFTPEVFGQPVELGVTLGTEGGSGVGGMHKDRQHHSPSVGSESGVSCSGSSSTSSDCASAEMNQTMETNGSLEITSVESEVMSPLDGLEDVAANISPPSPDRGDGLDGDTNPPFSELTTDEDTQDAVRSTGPLDDEQEEEEEEEEETLLEQGDTRKEQLLGKRFQEMEKMDVDEPLGPIEQLKLVTQSRQKNLAEDQAPETVCVSEPEREGQPSTEEKQRSISEPCVEQDSEEQQQEQEEQPEQQQEEQELEEEKVQPELLETAEKSEPEENHEQNLAENLESEQSHELQDELTDDVPTDTSEPQHKSESSVLAESQIEAPTETEQQTELEPKSPAEVDSEDTHTLQHETEAETQIKPEAEPSEEKEVQDEPVTS